MSKLHPTTLEDGDDASASSTTTSSPTLSPTVSPTLAPTLSPSLSPTLAPTLAPTSAPTVSRIVVSGVRGPALWDVAKADCEADGMQLPVIRSQADNDDLVAAAAGVKLWLGATDEDVEGAWTWVDGTDFESGYKNWDSSSPAARWETEDYIVMKEDGKWTDARSQNSNKKSYVCETGAGRRLGSPDGFRRRLGTPNFKCDSWNNCKLFECIDYRYILSQCSFVDGVDCHFQGEEWEKTQTECLSQDCDRSNDCDLSGVSMIEQKTATVVVNMTFADLSAEDLTTTGLGSVSVGLSRALNHLNISNDDVSATHVNALTLDVLFRNVDRRRRLADIETVIRFTIAVEDYYIETNPLVDQSVAQAKMDAVLLAVKAAANDGSLLEHIRAANEDADSNVAIADMFFEGGEDAVVGATKVVVAEVMSHDYQAVYDPEKYIDGYEGEAPVNEATMAAMTTAAAVAVVGAVAGSVAGAAAGAAVGGAAAGSAAASGSSGGGGGGGGDVISMIFAVQFVSLTSQLDLPDAHSSFRDTGTGFAWANFQFKPPFRIGDLECQGAETADAVVVLLEPGEEEERENPLTSYLRSMDMSAEEMFVSTFLLGCFGAGAFYVLHMKFLSTLENHMKKKNPNFTPPSMILFPAPEIILFVMYYNGILQSALVIVVAPCVGAGWRVFGALVCCGVVLVVAAMLQQIHSMLEEGNVHGGKCGQAATNPHFEFVHKFENGDKTVRRFKQALTVKGMGKSGKWIAKSDKGKVAKASFNTLFKKFGATGLNFYFINIIRKSLFTIFLTVVPQIASENVSGPAQLFLTLVVTIFELLYILTRLPYLKMSDNLNEINVLATQISVLVPPALGFMGLMTWEEVNVGLASLSFFSIGYVVLRQMKAMIVDPVVERLEKISSVVPIDGGDIDVEEGGGADIEMPKIDELEVESLASGGLGDALERVTEAVEEAVKEVASKVEEKVGEWLKDAILAYRTAAKDTAARIISEAPDDDDNANVDPAEVGKASHAAGVEAAKEVICRARSEAMVEVDRLKTGVEKGIEEVNNLDVGKAEDDALGALKAALKEMVLGYCEDDLLPVVTENVKAVVGEVASAVGGDKLAGKAMDKFQAVVPRVVDKLVDVAFDPASASEVFHEAIHAKIDVEALKNGVVGLAGEMATGVAGGIMEDLTEAAGDLAPEGFAEAMAKANKIVIEVAGVAVEDILKRVKEKVKTVAIVFKKVLMKSLKEMKEEEGPRGGGLGGRSQLGAEAFKIAYEAGLEAVKEETRDVSTVSTVLVLAEEGYGEEETEAKSKAEKLIEGIKANLKAFVVRLVTENVIPKLLEGMEQVMPDVDWLPIDRLETSLVELVKGKVDTVIGGIIDVAFGQKFFEDFADEGFQLRSNNVLGKVENTVSGVMERKVEELQVSEEEDEEEDEDKDDEDEDNRKSEG
ncbi:hypothetical protein TrVE_jg13630 [Triparma verrucosa]|uniref:C-type lectin domain-containing protein n=1 Tax=Triparma verrucosa TaxID=1606542 RepID=A0A9W7B6V3_9STRA|nr:hypothetical protein TrVE_jg13630 [Triparma verrucosa]